MAFSCLVLLLGCALLGGGLVGCGHSPANGPDGYVPPPADGGFSDGGASDLQGPGGDGPVICPNSDGGAAAVARPMYPDPRYADLHQLGSAVKTACVDSGALGAHARLDALAPKLIAEIGLAAVAPGAGCDLSISYVAAPPILCGAAAAAWTAAGTSAERYFVGADSPGGKAAATLYAGNERAALYALRAALALVQPDGAMALHLMTGTIVDYPSFDARGVVEGIYGPSNTGTYDCSASTTFYSPYRVLERVELIRLMARLRMNVFLYGPKCDLYARGNWATLYPASNGEVITTAAHEADANLVKFIWSVSPGYAFDFANYAAQLAQMKAKIDQVRGLGVSHFALFWDDTAGTTTGAQQAMLMNDIDTYIKASDPTDHLMVVGQPYCGPTGGASGNFCNGPTADSMAYGTMLHPDIEIFWTGTAVEPATYTAGQLAQINTAYKRKVTVWDNWPAVGGSFTGRSADLPTAVQGYYANPVLSEYINIANAGNHDPNNFLQVLGPIGDYTWSSDHYAASAQTQTESYNRWQPILTVLKPSVGACPPCGANVTGWTCNPADGKTIFYCDGTTKCLTTLQCPGGCMPMGTGTPDACK